MSAISRKARVRLVWPGSELDGREGTIRRVMKVRKPDGTPTTGYIVALDKPLNCGRTRIDVFADRVAPLNGGA